MASSSSLASSASSSALLGAVPASTANTRHHHNHHGHHHHGHHHGHDHDHDHDHHGHARGHAHGHAQPLRYTQATQADEDFLDLLTSGAFSPAAISAPLLHHNHPLSPTSASASASASPASRRPLSTLAALRRPPIDPIVLAATLSSGPHVTRHHFHHSFDGKPPDASRSQQMPASVRRAKIREQQEQRRSQQAQRQAQQTQPPRQDESHLHQQSDHVSISPERPRYISNQAPRSVRLAREGLAAPEVAVGALAAAASAAQPALQSAVIAAPQTALTQHQHPSMRRFPQPFPEPPLIVRCHARTRIPTPHGEVFAYIYKNNRDLKEHLALVVDPAQNDEAASVYYRRRADAAAGGGGSGANSTRVRARRREIRSRTLDEVWAPDESDMERIVRGAYVGRLSGDYQIASAPPLSPHALANGASAHAIDDDDGEDDDDDDEELDPPLVRIHSECYTGETIGSQRCDCGEQLDEAIRLIAAEDEIMNPPRQPRASAHHHRQHGKRGHRHQIVHHRAIVDSLEHSVDSLSPSVSFPGAETNPHTPLLTGAPPSPTLLASQQLQPPSEDDDEQRGHLPTRPRHPRRARGIVVYLRQEGRGIGLLDKLMAYNLQDMGHDTVSANILLGHSADARKYDIAAAILRDLGVSSDEAMSRRMRASSSSSAAARSGVRLLTNNPEKVEGMEREGVQVVERVPMVPRMWRTRRTEKRKSRKERSKGGKRKKNSSAKRIEKAAAAAGADSLSPAAVLVSRRVASRSRSPLASPTSAGPGAAGAVFRHSLLAHSTDLAADDDDGNLSQAAETFSDSASLSASEEEDEAGSDESSDDDGEGSESDSDDSYTAHVLRRSGATMIGADVTRSAELEKYLRTKVERMGHMLDLPSHPSSSSVSASTSAAAHAAAMGTGTAPAAAVQSDPTRHAEEGASQL
ncbi:GTP cyclohydrolase II [Tilletia horrida]|uniref:GTP cyclohydrolase II n=1 Tax=Tilletia horrida TaxID=155126 RepID=A0AAN6JKA2_9BASI|nr:GTP cyclohydrolase II [Tilletia horrida]KAK0529255.1 GTP cyclohydrolase II [Tilletia horrida]KAK0529266.1 GTP cyclohydrolase II [Tilletia horrida]KAK0556041.1 GTP cyclohydrolase II [Tilletia horrida]